MKEINKKVEIMLSEMEFEKSEKETLEIMLKDMLVEQEEQELKRQEEIKVEKSTMLVEEKETIKILVNEDNLIVVYEEIGDLEGSIEITDEKMIDKIKTDGLLDINDNFHFKYLDGKLSKKKATKESIKDPINPLLEKIIALENRVKELEGDK